MQDSKMDIRHFVRYSGGHTSFCHLTKWIYVVVILSHCSKRRISIICMHHHLQNISPFITMKNMYFETKNVEGHRLITYLNVTTKGEGKIWGTRARLSGFFALKKQQPPFENPKIILAPNFQKPNETSPSPLSFFKKSPNPLLTSF